MPRGTIQHCKLPTLIIFFLCSMASFFCSTIIDEKKEEPWVLAISDFSVDSSVPSSFMNYIKSVPNMFHLYLDVNTQRVIPATEKKARTLVKSFNKKMKLIKERSNLIKERDELFLSFLPEKTKEKNKKKLTKAILEKEKAIERASVDVKMDNARFFQADSHTSKITFWKNGDSLFNNPTQGNVSELLERENVSALIMGSVKDIAGYAYLSVRLTTGLVGMPDHEFFEAGRYQDIDQMVQSISSQLLAVLQNAKTTTLSFDVEPKTTVLSIETKKIVDFTKPITIYEGAYTVFAEAEEYTSSLKKITLKSGFQYTLKIKLERKNTVSVGFDFPYGDPNIFFHTRFYGTSGDRLDIEKGKNIFTFNLNDINTFAIVNSQNMAKANEDGSLTMFTKLNKKNTRQAVEKQRKVFYWSLGAFYFILPVNMILNGIAIDKINAYKNNRVVSRDQSYAEIQGYTTASYVTQGVTVAVGINCLVQLIRYLVTADKALPRESHPIREKPLARSHSLDSVDEMHEDAENDKTNEID